MSREGFTILDVVECGLVVNAPLSFGADFAEEVHGLDELFPSWSTRPVRVAQCNAIVGELIVGKDSRAIGQLVDRNANDVTFVYLNDSKFQIGEVVNFKESAIETVIQGVEVGNYIDRTDNYNLDKGHKEQYCDYSAILRNQGSAVQTRPQAGL